MRSNSKGHIEKGYERNDTTLNIHTNKAGLNRILSRTRNRKK